MKRCGGALISFLLAGCMLQAGGYGGKSRIYAGAGDRTSYGGALQARLAAGTKRSQAVRFHLGLELDGHAEEDYGSLVFSGLQGGVGLWPEHWISVAPYVAYGMPAGWSNTVTGSYFGLSVEAPIRLFGRTHASEINRNYRFLDSEDALVPFVRFRRYSLTVGGAREDPSFEFVVGLSVRTELVTDLIDPGAVF